MKFLVIAKQKKNVDTFEAVLGELLALGHEVTLAIQQRDPERDGVDESAAWPVATDTSWASYRSDSAVHATYWIAGWPRVDVGAAFLSPLLLHTQVVRSIAVTLEPIPPLRAIREVEAARTSDVADEELRGRMGFVDTARRRNF